MEIDDGQYRGPYAVKIEDEGVDAAPSDEEEYTDESDHDLAGEREEEKDEDAPAEEVDAPVVDLPIVPPVAVEVPKNKGGRPRLAAIDLTRKLWPESTKTVADLLTRYFMSIDHNKTSDAASREGWETHRWALPNGNLLPTWDQAQICLLHASPVKAKHYVVCTSDCEMHPVNLEMMTDKDISALKKAECSTCKLPFANAKGQFNRVSTSGKIAHAARSAR
jgi:hypothetical protein